VRGFIVNTAITAVAFYVVTRFLPQFISYKGELAGLIALAVIFGAVNGLIGPVVRILAFPLNVMTMGLIGLVINAGLLLVTAFVAKTIGFDFTVGHFPPHLFTADTILAAIVASVLLSAVGTAVRLVLPD